MACCLSEMTRRMGFFSLILWGHIYVIIMAVSAFNFRVANYSTAEAEISMRLDIANLTVIILSITSSV